MTLGEVKEIWVREDYNDYEEISEEEYNISRVVES